MQLARITGSESGINYAAYFGLQNPTNPGCLLSGSYNTTSEFVVGCYDVGRILRRNSFAGEIEVEDNPFGRVT
jgi:hypothetical protein